MANQLNLPMIPKTQPFSYHRTRNQDLNQQASHEQLNQRLIEVLEEEKESDRNNSRSPRDALYDTFNQYGMRLGPELMRLSMESAHEDSDNEGTKKAGDSDEQTDNEREEEDFLAEQRHTSKMSNPGSGKVSL